MKINIDQESKRFGTFYALNEVSLQVEEGELVALLGPSGSGKTTLLRVIAGLEHPDQGEIHIKRDSCYSPQRPGASGGLCVSTLCFISSSIGV